MKRVFRSDFLNVTRHGRQKAQSMRVAKNNLRAVVPAAPDKGKSPLAKLAPVWMETMAKIRSKMELTI